MTNPFESKNSDLSRSDPTCRYHPAVVRSNSSKRLTSKRQIEGFLLEPFVTNLKSAFPVPIRQLLEYAGFTLTQTAKTASVTFRLDRETI